MRADNASLHSRRNRRHRRRIFQWIKFALFLNRFLDALVLFHSNRLDPSHALSPPKILRDTSIVSINSINSVGSLSISSPKRAFIFANACPEIKAAGAVRAAGRGCFGVPPRRHKLGYMGSDLLVTRVIAGSETIGNNA